MKRTPSLLVAVLLVGTLFWGVPLTTATTQENDTETLPGEQFAGAVGAQDAELDGELEARAFGIAVANADSDAERADIIADRLERNQEQLSDIEARQETLRERREAGEISEGTYRAKIAITAAETSATNRTTNQAAVAATDLPENVRADRGINEETIRTLQTRAADLTGPQVADIARDIAGENVGAPFDPADRPGSGPERANLSDETPDGDPPHSD